MTRKTYGLLAGVIGLGAWWYTRRRGGSSRNNRVQDRGTVIFDNTPTASSLPGEG